MQLLIDEETRAVKTWAGGVISSLTAKRRDVFAVAVRFARGELPAGAAGVLGIKASGVFAGDFLASAASWVKSGRGAQAMYVFLLDLNQEGLEAAFSAAPAAVACQIEIEATWAVSGVQRVVRSLAVPISIANSVIQGDEGAVAPSGVWRFVQVDDGTVRGVAIQALGAGDEWVDQVRFVEQI
jgi:hypothetical protein